MHSYLATAGRDKVGFSIVGRPADGVPQYVRGAHSAIERNTMRYYLAIEAYLGALSLPAPQRFDMRLAVWYAGVERYPRQLHDLERDEYLALKSGQGTAPPGAVTQILPKRALAAATQLLLASPASESHFSMATL